MSLLYLINLVLERWRLVAGTCLVLAVATVGISALLPARYTSSMSFTAVSQDASGLNLSQLSGLAAQFGMRLPGRTGGPPPQFYVDLMKTPPFLRELAQSSFRVATPTGVRTGTVMDLYHLSGGSTNIRLDNATRLLATDLVSAQADMTTGVITVSVRTKWPDLSQEIAQRTFELLDEHNLAMQRTQAAAQLRFFQERLDTASAELRGAEDALEEFQSANREFHNNPALVAHYDRLQRDVSMRQQVFTTVMQGYEQARMEAARNTPSLAPVAAAVLPLRADRRQLALKAFFAVLIGVVLSILVIFGGEFLRTSRELDPAEAARFAALTRQFGRALHLSPRR